MAYDKKKIPQLKLKIIDGMANGNSLKSILDNNKDMPSRPIIYGWLNHKHKDHDEEFLNNFMCARTESADLDAERIQEIGEKVLTGEYDPKAARVALEALKWTSGKKNPKKYGDRIYNDVVIDDKRKNVDDIFPSTEELTED